MRARSDNLRLQDVGGAQEVERGRQLRPHKGAPVALLCATMPLLAKGNKAR